VPTPQHLQDFVLDSLTKRKEVADVRTASYSSTSRTTSVLRPCNGCR